MALWKQTKNNNLGTFIQTLLSTNLPFKINKIIKQSHQIKSFIQFTVFAIYFIFKNSGM